MPTRRVSGRALLAWLPAVLVFVGAISIVIAVAVPLWLMPRLTVIPIDIDSTTVAHAAPRPDTDPALPARVFDRCSVQEPRARVLDAQVTQQRRTVTVQPSSDDSVTFHSGQTVLIDRVDDGSGPRPVTTAPAGSARGCEDGLLTANVDEVSLDRHSGEPDGKLARVYTAPPPNGQASTGQPSTQGTFVDAPRRGVQYKFPFDVQRRTYLYYDVLSRRDLPARFVGDADVKGVHAYRFVNEVPPLDQTTIPTPEGGPALGTSLTMPARWWGIGGVDPATMVTLHRFSSSVRRVWVEPRSGVVMNGSEELFQYFGSPPDTASTVPAPIRDFRLDVFRATLAFDDATIDTQSTRARDAADQIHTGRVVVPIVAGTVGAVLLIVGAILLIRRRTR